MEMNRLQLRSIFIHLTMTIPSWNTWVVSPPLYHITRETCSINIYISYMPNELRIIVFVFYVYQKSSEIDLRNVMVIIFSLTHENIFRTFLTLDMCKETVSTLNIWLQYIEGFRGILDKWFEFVGKSMKFWISNQISDKKSRDSSI